MNWLGDSKPNFPARISGFLLRRVLRNPCEGHPFRHSRPTSALQLGITIRVGSRCRRKLANCCCLTTLVVRLPLPRHSFAFLKASAELTQPGSHASESSVRYAKELGGVFGTIALPGWLLLAWSVFWGIVDWLGRLQLLHDYWPFLKKTQNKLLPQM
jgi:hypothetical protein